MGPLKMPIQRHQICQLKVILQGSKPTIWRRLLVPSDTNLQRLHHIIQVAMGWGDYHMHLFTSDKGQVYGALESDHDGMLGLTDETTATIGKLLLKPKKKLLYEYDLGDSWVHEVVLEKQIPLIGKEAPPCCTGAVGACPPEDVGGLGGFYHFLKVINDPTDDDYEDTASWYGSPGFNPEEVDLEIINDSLARELWLKEPEDFDLDAMDGGAGGTFSADTIDQLQQFLAGQDLDSEEHVQAAIERFMAMQHASPVSDFHGLNPDQMHNLFYRPFASPQLLTWSFAIADSEQAPITCALKVLVERLQEKDINLTAKGNLPLAIVRPMLQAMGEEDTLFSGQAIRSEEQAMGVHVTRLVAEMAGYVAAAKGKLRVTRATSITLNKTGWPGMYEELVKTTLQKFNWAYLDGFEELQGIQGTAAFIFWLLHRYGDQWRPQEYYCEAMLRAFPQLRQEVREDRWAPADDILKYAIEARAFKVFRWLGLVEQRTENPTDKEKPWRKPISVRATPMLEQLLAWK